MYTYTHTYIDIDKEGEGRYVSRYTSLSCRIRSYTSLGSVWDTSDTVTVVIKLMKCFLEIVNSFPRRSSWGLKEPTLTIDTITLVISSLRRSMEDVSTVFEFNTLPFLFQK